jgi:hypothetical protein
LGGEEGGCQKIFLKSTKRKDERGKKTECSTEVCRKDWKGNEYDGKKEGVSTFNVGLANFQPVIVTI